MQITMDDSRLSTVSQLKVFLNASQKIIVSLEDQGTEEKYQFIEKTIKQFSYTRLSKKEKRVVLMYIRKMTGYKRRQLFRLVAKAEKGTLKKALYKRVKPAKIYTCLDSRRA